MFNYYSRPFGFDNGDGTAGGMSGSIKVIPEPAATTFLWLGLLAAAILRRENDGPADSATADH